MENNGSGKSTLFESVLSFYASKYSQKDINTKLKS